MSYNFIPKKAVKSFQDLEVYQRALEASVFVARFVVPALLPVVERSASEIVRLSDKQPQKGRKGTKATSAGTDSKEKTISASGRDNVGAGTIKENIAKNMASCALGLPHLIAEAHSFRFGSQTECLALLEKVMVHCNKMIVYLEQTRDIGDTKIEWERFEELIKKYLDIRRKVLHLQRSWKKYIFHPDADVASAFGKRP